jgi:hypothetical protein
MASDSSSCSSSSSSSSRSSSERRHRKEKKRKRKREKRERKKEKESRHASGRRHHHHEKRKKAKTERSTVSGKRIKRAEGATADAEGEARREALRAAMNEGEDHEYGVAASSAHSQTATAQAMQARAREAISDPAKMAELMRASADKERAKRQRLSNLQSGGVGGDDYASAIGREYAQQRSNATGRRTAYDAADYMKRDGGF